MNLAQAARMTTGYTQEKFCEVFGIPLGNQRNHEQELSSPGAATVSYLELIKNNPKQVERMRDRLPKKSK